MAKMKRTDVRKGTCTSVQCAYERVYKKQETVYNR